jgi:DnaJ-class molecular chaperone
VSVDPYAVLGVSRDATQDEIQKAYRQLAKKLHPDLNPGNDKAEAQFKDVTGAYSLLGDAAKRKRFDAGEIDDQGAEKPQQRYYRDFADSEPNPYASGAGFSDFEGAEDIFSGIFERGGGGERGAFKMRGGTAHYQMAVTFLDAVNGAQKQIQLPEGSMLDIAIPPGTRDGQILRLRGKGRPGHGGGPAGDAMITIEVLPHPYFTRDGDDIRLELPISLREAVLGGPIRVPTTTGAVEMKAPPWSNTGAVLRLKGKGAPGKDGVRGDEYVTLKLRLPDKPDPELTKFLSEWKPSASDNPRAAMEP